MIKIYGEAECPSCQNKTDVVFLVKIENERYTLSNMQNPNCYYCNNRFYVKLRADLQFSLAHCDTKKPKKNELNYNGKFYSICS